MPVLHACDDPKILRILPAAFLVVYFVAEATEHDCTPPFKSNQIKSNQINSVQFN